MFKALIVRKPHSDNIVDDLKPWEMRSSATHVRGRIGIIEAGSGLIVGEAELIGCGFPLTEEEAARTVDLHRVEDIELLKKWRYPWWLINAERYKKPIPYTHPKGAVIWVNVERLGDE